jgi:O-antigen ligase
VLDQSGQMKLRSRFSPSGMGLNVFVVATVLVVAGLSAVLIPGDSVKYCIGLAVLGVAALVALRGSVRTQAFMILLFITFPVTLGFAGQDALTTGTLVILLCLGLNTITGRATWTRRDGLVIGLLLGIILTAALGAITGGGAAYWGQELRQWLSLAAGVGGFLLVVGWARAAGTGAGRVVEGVTAALLWVMALHVVLSLVFQALPGLQEYFSIFMYTGQQSFTGVVEGQFTRATTVFASGEGFGEILLLVFPFCIYKLFRSSLVVYLPLTLLLVVGVVATATRSAILLVVLQIVLFSLVLLSRRVTRARSIVVLGLAVIAVVAFSPLYASAITDSMQRLDVSVTALQRGSSLMAAVNRSEVWPNAVAVTRSHLSLFGHGPVQAFILNIGEPYNFHSLYLTLLFEFGVLGTAAWIIFFVQLGARLFSALRKIPFRTDPGALLLTACLISLLCFLLNEIKFDFNRADSPQQLVRFVFAIFYASAFAVERKANGTDRTE